MAVIKLQKHLHFGNLIPAVLLTSYYTSTLMVHHYRNKQPRRMYRSPCPPYSPRRCSRRCWTPARSGPAPTSPAGGWLSSLRNKPFYHLDVFPISVMDRWGPGGREGGGGDRVHPHPRQQEGRRAQVQRYEEFHSSFKFLSVLIITMINWGWVKRLQSRDRVGALCGKGYGEDGWVDSKYLVWS